MRKYFLYTIILLSAAAFTSCTAGYVVSEQPAEVVYTRPVAPGPNYVWVGGDWVWTGGRYQWTHGYWSHPRAGYHWQEGHWNHVRSGYRWQEGGWHRW